MERSIQRKEQGDQMEIIPVIILPCDWNSSPLGEFQGLPKNATPVSKWEDRDEAYLDIVKGIRTLLKSFQSKRKEEEKDSHLN